ncbi:thymidylate synthase, flavin-dependent [Alkaliphilus metalliredigens QYMF]|uniref:Flavin-dependent thymidylate synthase n=1 Tax=Alkaliphilus metalliredigens (strain QYMF) TaxID=293826 RepID=A6TWK2_ALKMQ|nr:FAD-dependent thymidylate synthase [Alkaliphilus metalliredigens]ABR50570.1 thymidylate synthase, flavin-dependent [Alkaliphilus metalliredigens QYMF]
MKTNLKVELIGHTPEPEKLTASAAKLCYSNSDIQSLRSNLQEDKVKGFIDMLAGLGHESPFEHISFTFGIEGVSRSLTHQLVRHRIGSSYSQKSQRYVKEGSFEYVIPPEVESDPRAVVLFIKTMEEIQGAYDRLAELLFQKHYQGFVDGGQSPGQAKSMAEKKAIEDARFVLPNACETKIVVTMNARALFNFFHHRCCNRAQWEIKELAIEMLRLLKDVAPTVFKYCGPGCIHGKCPEGSMSCGKMKEVKERFQGL